MPGCSTIARPMWRKPRRTTASRRRATGAPRGGTARWTALGWYAFVSAANRRSARAGRVIVGNLRRWPPLPARSPDRERAALADLLDELGPDAPTCCEGWTTAHLAAHLVVRDRRPDACPATASRRPARRPARRLGAPAGGPAAGVDALRRGRRPRAVGPAALVAAGLAACRRSLNTTEYAIHHEDVRRAQPGWEPRDAAAGRSRTSCGPRPRSPPAAAPAGAGWCCAAPTSPGWRGGSARGGRTVAGEPLELLLWAGRPPRRRPGDRLLTSARS